MNKEISKVVNILKKQSYAFRIGVVFELLRTGNIQFIDLSNMYNKYLEDKNKELKEEIVKIQQTMKELKL